MKKSTEREGGRVNKREFVSRVARRAGVPVRVANGIYEAFVEEVLDIAGNGDRLTLTGFGKFYPQKHKGHRVQFKDEAGETQIPDYAVLKFSATRSVNKNVKPAVENVKPAVEKAS